MFILSYIYSTIIILFCFIKSMENSDFWSFILFGSIFAFLYANLIVLCKYAAIFVEKNIKKEKLSEKNIYYLCNHRRHIDTDVRHKPNRGNPTKLRLDGKLCLGTVFISRNNVWHCVDYFDANHRGSLFET